MKNNIQYWIDQLDDMWLENMKYIHKGKNIDEAIKQSFGHLISDETRLNNADASDFKKLVNTWLSKMKPEQTQRKKAFEL